MTHSNSYKIIVLGDPAVGKTSLLKRMIQDNFERGEPLSVGVNILNKKVSIGSVEVLLNLWDVEEVSELFQMEEFYFDGTKGIVIVYDVTRTDSLKSAVKWCKRCTENGLIHIPRILIGNKIDLFVTRKVSKVEGEDIANKIHAYHVEASASNGENVNEAFLKIAKLVYDLHGII